MSGVEIASAEPGGEQPQADRRIHAIIVAVALVVVVAASLAVVTHRLSTQRAQNSSRNRDDAAISATYLAGPNALAAEAAASRETRLTLTYNYKTLPADYAAAEVGLTPKFRAGYKTTTTSLTPTATKTQAVSTAAVTAEGVSAASANAVTVLLFVDQTVTNNLIAQPRLDRTRIKVSMVKVDGKWLIDGLSPL